MFRMWDRVKKEWEVKDFHLILKYETDIYEVIWDEVSCGYRAIWTRNPTIKHVPADDFEVVGNIWEHPYLLKI